MDLKEKIIDVNRIYEGKKINVDVLKVKMPNNKEAIREIVDRKNGVVIFREWYKQFTVLYFLI